MDWLAALAEAVQASQLGIWAGESPRAYPLANLVHILGLVMLVGGIGLVDLRLAGLFRALPPEALSRALTPVALTGLVLMIGSGTVLFAADTAVAQSPVFRWKLLLIAAALVNAVAFRLLWRRRIGTWAERPPIAGRAMATLSLMLWLSVGTCGRMIAYS
ncbi:hypothetical protein RCO27_10780 [Sphingosinicella sp. LHD-64]|uniref:DUF6644 family protein n=1 Tax=Sphingosinicella sp. LHD-64 TaxID=3072139 RepID=UPI00280C9076|nr:DUF6644 family protein [Sphingosinicella sp. LHD-64]MDQ8756712.1 hypothetical protein [Sphingosinicella sp. LHD-64]